jgi:F420H(2)-dependent biliverdin reductase
VTDQSDALLRLQTERNVWLCTVRPDGRPHLVPIWFVFVDDRFWIATGLASVKVRNVMSNPRVVVSLENGDTPLIAECSATVVTATYPVAICAAFVAKYEWDIELPDDPDVGTTALLELVVDKWLMGWSQT